MDFCTRPCARKPNGAALVASSYSFTGYGQAAGEGYVGASRESGGAAADYGGSAVEVSGEEEKKIHLVLDGIVSRLGDDIVDTEKKHKDAEIAFEKESKEAKEAKVALDADQRTFDMTKGTFDLAQTAVNTAAKAYKKQAEEEEAAKNLAMDESWKQEVKALESAISALSTLREEVKKLNSARTTMAITTTTAPETTTTTITEAPAAEIGVGEVKELRKGSYRFVMQGDGNVVLYDGSAQKWSSGTHGNPNAPFKLLLQGDGNLVAYDKNNAAIWSSGSHGNSCVLKLQGDGNVVIYGDDGQPKWNTGTR